MPNARNLLCGSLRIKRLAGELGLPPNSATCPLPRIKSLHWVGLLALLAVSCGASLAQSSSASSAALPAPAPLITQAVDNSQRVTLKGNTHPLARPQFDRGAAPPDLPMQRMLLALKRSPAQEAALESLIQSQQAKTSANHHQWLTPQQFGQEFGLGDSDVQTITAWLQSQGFQVTNVSNGRTVIEFSGTAGQVQSAFHTAIHKYRVNGEDHWANASDPSIPAALAPAVTGVVTLHNFPRRSYLTVHRMPPSAKLSQEGVLPLFTFTSDQTTYYGLGPADFATIYNVLPLWNAGIDGTGQTIAIVGETNIHVSDVQNFRNLFGLPQNNPQIIVNGEDPGVDGDESEALLDVSWSGAVAKKATIDLVVSASTETTLGVDLSALYIVDNNIAPVMSESYGECESALGNAGNAFYNSLWQQAAAEGITVLVSAGDGGSAGCDNFDTSDEASQGLAVSGFASTPYNVAVGGTDFDQTPVTAPNYWNATNNTATAASAKSYIPEVVWNDSCVPMGIQTCQSGSDFLDIIAGSGGPSSCSTQDTSGNCTSGYPKPSWQTGTGVPTDGVRDLPDVSLFASNGFNYSFYIICEADAGFLGTTEACSLSEETFLGVGGTSASAPAFAGIMALVNQKMAAQGASARQGDANYILYKLAAQPGASCNSSTVALTGNSCLFYDVTQGTNSVPCMPGTPDCSSTLGAGIAGELADPQNPNNPAWLAGPGYDLATGLGSVNAENLVNGWGSVTFLPSATTISNLSPASVTHGQPVNISVAVAPQSGSGTPTGSVALFAAPSGNQVAAGVFPLTNGLANGATTLLPGGTYNVTAQYSGDSTYGGSVSAPVSVTVGKENSQTSATLAAYDYTTGTFYQTNTIPFGTIFFVRSSVANSTGAPCAPNPGQTQVGCPTGTVNFTLNGKTLDAGSYPLNSQGYTEDQTSTNDFTSLGNYSIAAQYSGDNSYNSSSGALTATVTQAPIAEWNFGLEDLCCGLNATVSSGQTFQISAVIYAWSVLQAPSGTITMLQNGAAPSGVFQTIPRNGDFSGNYSTGEFDWAYLAGNLTTTINTPGTYTFTASYAGDTYYASSQAPWSLVVTVLPSTYNITMPIPNVTIAAPGDSGTASVGLVAVDGFASLVNVSCTLPPAMTGSFCLPTNVNLTSVTPSAVAQLVISTAGRNSSGANRRAAMNFLGCTVFAGAFLLMAIPGARKRRAPQILLLLACIAVIGSCGGGGGGGGTQTNPETPPGTYTVNVSATGSGVTRTGTFQVTVQ